MSNYVVLELEHLLWFSKVLYIIENLRERQVLQTYIHTYIHKLYFHL